MLRDHPRGVRECVIVPVGNPEGFQLLPLPDLLPRRRACCPEVQGGCCVVKGSDRGCEVQGYGTVLVARRCWRVGTYTSRAGAPARHGRRLRTGARGCSVSRCAAGRGSVPVGQNRAPPAGQTARSGPGPGQTSRTEGSLERLPWGPAATGSMGVGRGLVSGGCTGAEKQKKPER